MLDGICDEVWCFKSDRRLQPTLITEYPFADLDISTSLTNVDVIETDIWSNPVRTYLLYSKQRYSLYCVLPADYFQNRIFCGSTLEGLHKWPDPHGSCPIQGKTFNHEQTVR
jgi:hypothetical protein